MIGCPIKSPLVIISPLGELLIQLDDKVSYEGLYDLGGSSHLGKASPSITHGVKSENKADAGLDSLDGNRVGSLRSLPLATPAVILVKPRLVYVKDDIASWILVQEGYSEPLAKQPVDV